MIVLMLDTIAREMSFLYHSLSIPFHPPVFRLEYSTPPGIPSSAGITTLLKNVSSSVLNPSILERIGLP